MYYEANCTCITAERWNELTKGARRCSYKKLVARIKKEMPAFYEELCLQYKFFAWPNGLGTNENPPVW